MYLLIQRQYFSKLILYFSKKHLVLSTYLGTKLNIIEFKCSTGYK